jgi:EAL domain-containing protein (putative c-di-GMP-specific phosphodiesterase class I)
VAARVLAERATRTLGWVRTTALAMGGSNQSLFLLGALLLTQGSAALPLLAVGLLLSLVAMPGWIELLLMWPSRVGGIAAACGEAFRPYSPVLANLAGTCYWWGWVPTCGLTALISAAALHAWMLPWVPVSALATGTITQYELLIRMRSDAGDLIPPAAFLETAERSGMIRQIDRWVVESACRMIAQAKAAGDSLCLEINVSGVSVSDPEFLASIEPFLATIRDHADDLVFELTETAAIVNLAHATAFAEGLAESGFRLALDDFGAGFGSFYYLKHLPCAYLKIDGEFIKNLPSSRVDQVFVRAIVELAKGLNKLTIAEFVEDEATVQLLRELGVDYAQGYHVGRPAPLPTSSLHAAEAPTLEHQ